MSITDIFPVKAKYPIVQRISPKEIRFGSIPPII
tara:strand:- start:375 stop:476 length:102 start_codon:yes stop_codon:yes gene_type:complete